MLLASVVFFAVCCLIIFLFVLSRACLLPLSFWQFLVAIDDWHCAYCIVHIVVIVVLLFLLHVFQA